MKWTTALEIKLSGPAAPRVLTRALLVKVAALAAGKPVWPVSLGAWLVDAMAAGRLIRVNKGLYLNRMAQPAARLAEAASHVRAGAIVSLQYVLGEAGVLNNYTDWVTAVVPLRKNPPPPSPSAAPVSSQTPKLSPPRVGTVMTATGRFEFHAIPERIVFAGEGTDRLEQVPYLRATPEKAWLDWLYLASSPRGGLRRPPLDADIGELDARRLGRLIAAADREGAHLRTAQANWVRERDTMAARPGFEI